MPDSISLSANSPVKRYFHLGEKGIEDEFAGKFPHEEVKSGKKLIVPSTKEIWVAELEHKSGKGEWLVKSWGNLNKKNAKLGMGEIIARSIMSELLGNAEGVIVPEAYVYETPDNVHLVTRFAGGIPSVEDDSDLLRFLSPEIKAKIALCIIAAGIKEVPPSSIFIDKKTKVGTLIDHESIVLPDDGKTILPVFTSATHSMLSLLREMVPVDDPAITEKQFQLAHINAVEVCLSKWKDRITTDKACREELVNLIHVESGLPKVSDDGTLNASLIVENLIQIAQNIDKLNLPGSYKAFDQEQALEHLGNRSDILLNLIPILQDQIKRELPLLEAAVTSRDNATVKKIAHNIKGSIGIFHSDGASELIFQLEQMGANNNLENADKVFESFTKQLRKLLSALEDYKQQNTPK